MTHWILAALVTALTFPTISTAENITYDAVAQADKMLNRIDSDKNGSIGKQEYFRPSVTRFKRFDSDKNGVLTRDELIHYWKNKRKNSTDNPNAWNGPTNSHFSRFDFNKDEQITLQEYQTRTRKRFQELDADSNDIITKQELTDHWLARKKELDEYNESHDD